ncbi:hypothetical protein [Ammoniphilus sp. 3BR4]|uniref:hypothetical protein n=1 Tax=Ammoniphilus sp. 3BR4 TaxID=3158265 RepID=UPI003465BB2A
MQATAAAAVLYLADNRTIILRNVDKEIVEEIKSQCGNDRCICLIDGKEVDYGRVSHVIWVEQADIGD